MPQSLVTPLKNGSTTTEESNMYYIAPRNQRGNGGMIIWQHIKSLKNFKPTDTVEYVVARNKKERESDQILKKFRLDVVLKSFRYTY